MSVAVEHVVAATNFGEFVPGLGLCDAEWDFVHVPVQSLEHVARHKAGIVGRGRAKMKRRHGAVISFCGEVTRNLRPFQTKREVSRAFPFALRLNSRTERQKHGRRKPKKLNIAPESPKTLDYRLRYMPLFSTFASRQRKFGAEQPSFEHTD